MREVKPTQKPVPSSDIKDLFFNSGLLDIWATSLEPKYIDRFGNCHLTSTGMEWIFNELVTKFKIESEQALLAAGYAPAGTFQEGAEVVSRNGTVLWKLPDGDGDHYRWDGDLPKQVPAGSTPQSTGGIGKGAWVSVGEASLRSDLYKPDGWNLVGAGDTTVAGLAYVFTKIKNNIIKKEDLKQWVTDGITKGKTYFSIPTGEYTLESTDSTDFIEVDNLSSEKMHILDLNGSVLRYSGTETIESFIKIKGRSAYITVQNGRIFCNGKINYGVLTDDVIGISQFNNFEVRTPLLDGFKVSAWLCSFDNAIVFRPGRHGFYIGDTALTATSTSCIFKTCWTKSPKGHGFYLGRLTYANFINSAYDGDGAGIDNGHAVIGFHSFVYGLTITGMGTENYGGRLLKQDGDTFGIRGLTVNNWHLFKVGEQANPMDYLMDLSRITRMTISGISKNDVYAKNTGILRGDTSGDALIISPDGTGSGWIYGDGTTAPSHGFGTIEWSQLPIKRNRGVTKITKTVSTVDEFREYLSYLKTVTIDIGVEIILSSSLLLPSGSAPIVITGLRGGGYIKIMATTANIELGSRAVYKPFSIVGNDCTVIFSNLTLVGWNQSGTLFYVDSSKVCTSTCKFLAFAQGGIMFEAYNGSDITISSDCTKAGSWLPIGGYEFVIDTTSNISKRTRTGLKWDDI